MTKVCTTNQFGYNASGVMGLSVNALPRQVALVQSDSVNDGPEPHVDDRHGERLILVDQELHWRNPYTCAVKVLPIIKRRARLQMTTATKITLVRERATWLVGQDREQRIRADDPDPTLVYDSEWGGGMVVGSDTTGTGGSSPRTFSWLSDPESLHALPFLSIPAEWSVSIRFRASMAFLSIAGSVAAADSNQVWIRGNTLSLLAFPTPEETS